jgi:hypothetical protein
MTLDASNATCETLESQNRTNKQLKVSHIFHRTISVYDRESTIRIKRELEKLGHLIRRLNNKNDYTIRRLSITRTTLTKSADTNGRERNSQRGPCPRLHQTNNGQRQRNRFGQSSCEQRDRIQLLAAPSNASRRAQLRRREKTKSQNEEPVPELKTRADLTMGIGALYWRLEYCARAGKN